MPIVAREQQLIDRYLILPHPQERLNALVDRASSMLDFPPECKTDANHVPGCRAKVYLCASCVTGRMQYQAEADSLVVKGLVVLLCDLYTGSSPQEVIGHEPVILHRLGLWDILSPTRQEGLKQVRRHMIRRAEEHGAQS